MTMFRASRRFGSQNPELYHPASLHTSLEAKVSAYLAKIASDPKNRLQVFCTTHSDLMLQSAQQNYFVTMSKGKSELELCDRKTALEKAARLGISRWTHPILRYPLNPVILVEGKSDHAFLEQALKLLAPQKDLRVTYLDLLQGGDVKGGVEELLKYIKLNASAIRARATEAPVIVLLDWDSAKKNQEFEKLLDDDAPYKVFVWPDAAFNPRLGKAFHGIERHMPDRIIRKADSSVSVLGKKRDKSFTVHKDDYGSFKTEVFRVVQRGIKLEDLIHAKSFLQQVLRVVP